MVETETNTAHPAAFIYQPVAAPHQSFLSTGSEAPVDKKSSFPPGEAKGTSCQRASAKKAVRPNYRAYRFPMK